MTTNVKWSKLIFLFINLSFVIFNLSFADALTLNEAVDLALSKNPQVVAAKAKFDAAGSKLAQARSALFPRLKLEGVYGKYYQESLTAPNEAADLKTYTFSLAQPIFVASLPKLLTMADAGYGSAREDLRRAEVEVLFAAKNAYYNVLKARKGVQVIDKAEASLEKYLKLSRIYYDSGIIGREGVMRIETEVLNTRVARIKAKSGLRLAEAALNNLLGTRGSVTGQMLEEVSPVAVVSLPAFSELFDAALANRPDYRSFREGLTIAKESVGLAAANYWPSFMLIGSSGRTVSDYRNAGLNIDLDSWQVLLSGSWNIFDSFETPNKVAEARSNYQALAAQADQLRDGIELEVRSAYLEYQAAEEQIAAAQAATDLAQKTMRLSEVNYEQHITTFLSLLDSRASLTAAENSLWGAKYDLEIAKAKINKVVGKKIF
ncbi:MAG: TolC family protein [Candidatus Margulisbacteria bacterium]|nr:TolC family protein [Candidatus Margulisiibacteriota bacterium]MBU1616323.1 TolC family protein [Candidatus Margulisiibacteriota bacterium]